MTPTFTNFYFFCFLAALLIVYYAVPKRLQWGVLLIASVIYYLLTGNGLLIFYPVAACLTAYLGGRGIAAAKGVPQKRLCLGGVLVILLGLLIVLKYIRWSALGLTVLAPLGISFYTLSILSYVIDIYNGLLKPEKNPFRLLLYGLYFPNILSGPILRYREDGAQLFVPHPLSYRALTFGLQRMLWGLFKILVISERCAVVVDAVYADPNSYRGIYIVFATVLYAFQLYTNFSGSMDLVLGMSECLGLKMPENFDVPFLSETVAEYWRRWHITLGIWMKEYVFYPLLRTRPFTALLKGSKKRLGKRAGKQLTSFAGMLVLWLTVGLWHGGGVKYVIGSGLLHWLYIMLEELLERPFARLYERLKINPKNMLLRCVRVVRTFVLVCIGFVFFRADSAQRAVDMLKGSLEHWSLAVFTRGYIFDLGLDVIEFVILLVSLGIMIAVEVCSRNADMRQQLSEKALPVRWIALYALLFYTILLGYYGPGYSAAAFIYQGF